MTAPEIDTGQPGPSALRILLIDDNPRDRDLLVRELRRHFGAVGFEPVRDAAELDNALRFSHFDAAVLDYRLNWATGIEVLCLLRRARPHCPVIMFTASGTESVAVRAMRAGLDDYVIKNPRTYAQLPGILQTHLEQAQRHERLENAVFAASGSRCEPVTNRERLHSALNAVHVRAWEHVLSASERSRGATALGLIVPVEVEANRLCAEDITLFYGVYDRSIASGAAFRCEIRILTDPEGEDRWLQIIGQPWRDDVGRVARVAGISRRIDSPLRDSALESVANQHRGGLLDTLAHELRNSLASLRYASGLLETGTPPSMDACARLTVHRQWSEVTRLAEELVVAAGASPGALKLYRGRVQLTHLVRDAATAVAALAEASCVELSIRELGAHWVLGDEDRLRQVFRTLLSASICSAGPGARVRVEADLAGQYIEIRMSHHTSAKSAAPSLESRPGVDPRSLRFTGPAGNLLFAREVIELHGGELIDRPAGAPGELLVRLPCYRSIERELTRRTRKPWQL